MAAILLERPVAELVDQETKRAGRWLVLVREDLVEGLDGAVVRVIDVCGGQRFDIVLLEELEHLRDAVRADLLQAVEIGDALAVFLAAAIAQDQDRQGLLPAPDIVRRVLAGLLGW